MLDPKSSFLRKWNQLLVLACLFALALDPLFFYIPVIDGNKKCFDFDKALKTVACVLRTLIDFLYLLRIIFQFHTAFVAPSSRVFGRTEWVVDPAQIARRYLTSTFAIDVLSILPLPQVVVLIIIPSLHSPVSFIAKDLLKYVILSQYVPRIIRIYPLFKQVTSSSGILTGTAWAGAIFNLFLYMLASHILGAFWYLLSIESVDRCWRKVCKAPQCSSKDLYCGRHRTNNSDLSTFLKDSCPFINPNDIKNSTSFDFGMFADALESGLAETQDFAWKFFYCFWWGLRNLRSTTNLSSYFIHEFSICLTYDDLYSSLGQNLTTSNFVGEILFAVFISIAGLVLFALLIGNMQAYLQSITARLEEMTVKRRDAKKLSQWMSHRMLPENLRERIRRYEQYKMLETRGVEEMALIRSFPKDLRREIKRHLCLALIMRVPIFETLNEQTLDAICDCLRPVYHTECTYIVREGDPVDEMLFIFKGCLDSVTTNGGQSGFFNVSRLKAGDFCGEELLIWGLDPKSTSILPISTRTVRALTEVEAFALVAEDLKSLTSQSPHFYDKDMQHTFRFYSAQWRKWAACFIQAAWRRYWRRKQAKSLYQAQNNLATSPSLVATVYASQFAVNALRNLRQNTSGGHTPRLPLRLPLVPQKPAEPDFSARNN